MWCFSARNKMWFYLEVLWNSNAVYVLTEYKVVVKKKKKSLEASYSGIKCIYTFEKPEVKNVLDSSLMFTAMYLQGSSSHQCFASAMTVSSWPSHNEILGEKEQARNQSVFVGGSHISNAGKSRCPSLSGVSLYHPADDQPRMSITLHQQWHLPGICNPMSCTCYALWPDTDEPSWTKFSPCL